LAKTNRRTADACTKVSIPQSWPAPVIKPTNPPLPQLPLLQHPLPLVVKPHAAVRVTPRRPATVSQPTTRTAPRPAPAPACDPNSAFVPKDCADSSVTRPAG
jgi:hypothetical protein